jgi:radical SAM protein with 4Fe4S-binding SPASM domain
MVGKMKLPEMIQLESTTKCNLNCLSCSRRLLGTERLNKDLTIKNFKRIVKEIPSVKIIDLTGFGEFLLCEDIQRILEYGYSKRIKFRVISNGTILGKEQISLILKYFDSYYISFDSANKKNFEFLRKGTNYEKILNNITNLVRRKKEISSKTKIGLATSLSHLNYGEIPKIIKIAKELDVDSISLGVVENWTIPGEENFIKNKLFVSKFKDIEKKVLKIIKRYPETKINSPTKLEIFIRRNPYLKKVGIFVKKILKKSSSERKFQILYSPQKMKKRACEWCFNSCFITFDGYITPCCLRKNPSTINFGNIFETPFKKIWNSKKIREFRRDIIKDNPKNKCCVNCPF